MSRFDSQFAVSHDSLNDVLGQSATYKDEDSDATTITVRVQPLSRQQNDREMSRNLNDERMIAIGRDASDTDFPGIANPRKDATITLSDGTKWGVKEITNQSATETILRCVRTRIKTLQRRGIEMDV